MSVKFLSSKSSISNRSALHRWGAVGAMIAGLMALSGCFKVDMDLKIEPDDTVSGSAVFAINEEMAAMATQSSGGFDSDNLPEGTTVEDYKADGKVGQKATFKDVSIDELRRLLQAEGADSQNFSLTHENGEYTFTMSSASSISEGFGSGSAGDSSRPDLKGLEDMAKMMLKDAEFTVSVTFPGEIKDTNGKVDGKTVTWDLDVTKPTDLHATAAEASTADKAKDALSDATGVDDSGSSLLLIGAGVLAVILLALGGFYLVRRSAKTKS